MTSERSAAGLRGRRRSEAVNSAVIQAALELLAESGYDGLTMEGVAARAGVAKTTVYRRWPSRRELALALGEYIAAPVTTRQTGDLRRDIVVLLTQVAKVLKSPVARRVVARVLAEAQAHPELRAVLGDFWAGRRKMMLGLLQSAAERGELRPGTDLDVAADALYGPLYYRYLVTAQPLDRRAIEAAVDNALAGITISR